MEDEAEAEDEAEKWARSFRSTSELVYMLVREPNPKHTSLFVCIFDQVMSLNTLLNHFIEAAEGSKKGKALTNDMALQVLRTMDMLLGYGPRIYFDKEARELAERVLSKLEKWRTRTKQLESLASRVEQLLKSLDKNPLPREMSKKVERIWQTIPIGVTVFDYPPGALLFSEDAMTLAKQITAIDFETYRMVEVEELKNQSWNKTSRFCVARHVLKLIQRSNRLSFWVATIVLLQPRKKDRVKALAALIKVAWSLKEIRNYNSMLSVVAGMNLICISRLRRTFAQLSKRHLDMFEELKNLSNPMLSFKALRALMNQDAARRDAVCKLPPIGLSLSEIAMTEEGNDDVLAVESQSGKGSGEKTFLINMGKWELLYNCICTALMHQSADWRISEIDPPYSCLFSLPTLSEEILYQLSLAREPGRP
ncbi:ras guanine nucleotide exchange factor S-like [Schistocerca gregaria]|uniref:ras guanine nucleotide exchange factor S-like n=1 Tax=Schistocerca gregaria TaxID=7010 RepID=UPI00211F3F36|nr:ras guanine nucleotide exchange factor S-like [Schistocerca gregaria]